MNLTLPIILYLLVCLLLVTCFYHYFLVIVLAILTCITLIYFLMYFVKSLLRKEEFLKTLFYKSIELSIVLLPIAIFSIFITQSAPYFANYLLLKKDEILFKHVTYNQYSVNYLMPFNQPPYLIIDNESSLKTWLTSLAPAEQSSKVIDNFKSINFNHQVLLATAMIHGSCETINWQFFQDTINKHLLVTLVKNHQPVLVCNTMAHLENKVFVINKPLGYNIEFQQYDI